MKSCSPTSRGSVQEETAVCISPALKKRRYLPIILRYCLSNQGTTFSARNVIEGSDDYVKEQTANELLGSLCDHRVLTRKKEFPLRAKSKYLYSTTKEGMKEAKKFLQEHISS